MREISKKFGDKRRTEISQVEKDLDVEDLIADEDMVVTITHTGYVNPKRSIRRLLASESVCEERMMLMTSSIWSRAIR